MLAKVDFGRTGLQVTRLALGGYPFGGVNRARDWDPFTEWGRAMAVETIHAALDAGINYIDTAPGYGDGNSESVIGEATHDRRDRFILATKVGYQHSSPKEVIASVEASARRLRTDVIDVIQFHGGMYTEAHIEHILTGGLLDALVKLRDRGLVRFLGFTVEEPLTARPLVASSVFDVIQVRYNLIHQGAALHVLNEATAAHMGIATMRTMTSGIFQRLAAYLVPQRSEEELYELTLKFVLSDSRVHVPIVGMRWAEEVERNVALVNSFTPPFDVADLPRMTAHIYRTEDELTDQ